MEGSASCPLRSGVDKGEIPSLPFCLAHHPYPSPAVAFWRALYLAWVS